MRQITRPAVFSALVLVAGLLATPARADAIDGEWCNGASVLRIEGSTIVTPASNKIQGNYNRYRYSYIVPANEPGAGGEITMVMIRGQEIIHLTRPGAGTHEVWQRCKPVS